MASDWTLVDGNPAPGQPSGIRAKGKVFIDIGGTAQRANTELGAISNDKVCQIWEGEAADRFADTIEKDLLTALRKMDTSFHRAGHALEDFATTLERLQEEAIRELRKAQQADGDERDGSSREASARKAKSQHQKDYTTYALADKALRREYDLTLATRTADDPTYDHRYRAWRLRFDANVRSMNTASTNVANANIAVNTASADVSSARQRLSRARDEIRCIKEDRERAEKKAAGELEEATKIGVRNKSIWQQFKEKFTLKNLDDVLGKALNILAIVSLIALAAIAIVGTAGTALPGILAALVLVSTVISVAKAGVSVARATKGEKGWDEALIDVAFAAFDVFTLGRASGAKGALKGSATAVKNAKSAGGLAKALDTVAPFTGKLGKVWTKGRKFHKALKALQKITFKNAGPTFSTWRSQVVKNIRHPIVLTTSEYRKKLAKDVATQVYKMIPERYRYPEKVGDLIYDRVRETPARLINAAQTIPPIRVEVDLTVDLDMYVESSSNTRGAGSTGGGGGSW